MLQNKVILRVRGERPTRAGLYSRAEVSVSPAIGNGSMGQNQGGSQRAVSRWSDRGEFLRSPAGGVQRGEPVPLPWVTWGRMTSPQGYRQVGLVVAERAYRGRGTR